MNRPLLYFDGTNVMLIREQDVPYQKTDLSGYPAPGYPSYADQLEAAKKKAIRVEGGFSKRMVPLVGVKIAEITIFNEVTFCLGEGKTTDLPSGYTYKVEHHCIKCGLPDYEVNSCKAQEDCEEDQESVAIIKPVVVLPEEGEDELWMEMLSDLFDSKLLPNLYKFEVNNLKTKFNLTKK